MVNELEKEVSVAAFQEEIARLSEKLQKEQGQWERERVQWAQVINQLPKCTLVNFIYKIVRLSEKGKVRENGNISQVWIHTLSVILMLVC